MRSDFAKTPRSFLIHVRPAAQADLGGVLSILALNWYDIHHGIARDKLDRLIEDKVWPLYGAIIDGRRPDRQLRVIEQDGQVLGFSCHGVQDYAHEIHAIYVSPDHRHHSLGAMMMADIAERMMDRDKRDRTDRPVHIRICNDNEGARNFAKNLCGKILHKDMRPFLGTQIVDDVIGWQSPRDLRLSIRLSNPFQGTPQNLRGGSDMFHHPAP